MEHTLAGRLMTARTEQAVTHERTGIINLGGGELKVTYGVIPWREDQEIGKRHEKVQDRVERQLRLAADTLAAASLSSEAVVGGQTEPLPKLGVELATALGLDGMETDIQVVLALFPSERAMMEEFAAHEDWTGTVSKGIDETIEGESLAVS